MKQAITWILLLSLSHSPKTTFARGQIAGQRALTHEEYEKLPGSNSPSDPRPFDPNKPDVPHLMGMNISSSELKTNPEFKNLVIRVVKERPHVYLRKGTILRQSIRSGTYYKGSITIDVEVSSGYP